MNSIIFKIGKLRKKIHNSSGCNYLYYYFNDLIHDLDSLEKGNLPSEVSSELLTLIQDYATDCTYNTYGSANWICYSARCFYCADYLTNYLTKPMQQAMETFLNRYFVRLTEANVAPVLPKDVLARYIEIGLKSRSPLELYDDLIKKAISESYRFRLWDAGEVSLALSYQHSVSWLIHQYISRYSDYTMLKVWIPLLRTAKIVNVWYEYPDNHNYVGRYTREAVSKYLDEMLEIHLSIIKLWYWNNPQEVIEKLVLDDLIEALEVCDDEEFENILCHMATLPFNEKIERILEHFTNDDEPWIVNLSSNLLNEYKIVKHNDIGYKYE